MNAHITATHVERRSAAMQERARSYYTCSDSCHHAHQWAARRLITPTAFLAAARDTCSIADIAARLMVTVEDVNAYLGSLTADEFRIMRKLVGHEIYLMPYPTMQDVADHLDSVSTGQRFTVKKLATLTGISPRQVKAKLAGERPITTADLHRLATALGTTPGQVYGRVASAL